MSLLRKFVFGNNVKIFVRAASIFTKNSESIYRYEPDSTEKWPRVTKDMKVDYKNNGFIVLKNLLTQPELVKLLPALQLEVKPQTEGAAGDIDDMDHRRVPQTKLLEKLGYLRHDQRWGLVLWNEQGNDCLGVLAGNVKVAGIAEELLDRGEIYLYHGKMLRKEPKQGGAAEWHQDYATWYQNELILPDLVGVTIALTKSDRDNGGTQVIKGSHHCGRINHGVNRLQQGADEERVDLVKRALPTMPLDLLPGDSVFMHPNLLRSSGPNPSQHLRCHLKFVFNTKQNSPAVKHDYSDAVYTPLQTYPSDALAQLANFEIVSRDFHQTEKDRLESMDQDTLWDL